MPIAIKLLLDQYIEILQKIYGNHLKTVILYGSYARGDYKADSDIDIMILLDLSDMDIKQYRHELSGETFDFNMDHGLDIKPTGELYVLADGDEIATCVIANDEKVEGYADAPWQINSDEVIILHVLAVHPDYRGKGLARRLVENVIEQERKAGKKALRLDVIENNTTAEKLYQKLGFQYVQTKTLYYDVVGKMTFKLYELVL